MHYAFASRTDPGRVRTHNEDALLVDEARGLAVLADGMGGHKAGEVAAGMAVASIGTGLGAWLDAQCAQDGESMLPSLAIHQALAASVAEANRLIFDAAQAQSAFRGMGTTLVLAWFLGARLFIGHVGDSRAYRWRGGRLEQLTRDHSLLQEQLDAGLITPAQAALSTQRNLVTRALGVEPSVLTEIHVHAVRPGDGYLLCSDGLSDMVDDAGIAEILSEPWPPSRQAVALVTRANELGGRDNVSALLVQAAFDPPSSAAPVPTPLFPRP